MKKSAVLLLSALILAITATAQTSGGGKLPEAPAPKAQTAPAAADNNNQSASPFKDQKEKASYAIGLNVAASLHQMGLDIDPKILAQGVSDGLAGKPLMTDQEANTVLVQMRNEVQAKQAEKQKELAESNQKEGETFLAANKSKPGVVALPSGLQYKILTPGNGPKPATSDTVVCNYKGTFINGTEFDSSAKHGEPATFPVGGVIRGWTEALQLMPVGSKWELFIPSSLAYGERGAGRDIPPNATLIFEVELLSIKPKEGPQTLPTTPSAPKTQTPSSTPPKPSTPPK